MTITRSGTMILDAQGRSIDVALNPEQREQLFDAELARCDGPLILGPLTPVEGVQLGCLMQILQHHPDLPDEARAIATAVLDTVRGYFAHAPTVLAVLDNVVDAEEDAPGSNP